MQRHIAWWFAFLQRTCFLHYKAHDLYLDSRMPQCISLYYICACTGEHQYELLDYVAAKFHEEMGVFKLLVSQY